MPDTRHCAVTVMRHDFANSYGQPFTGTVHPSGPLPGAVVQPGPELVGQCRGPSVRPAGRGVDRRGRGAAAPATPEPDDDGVNWQVEKDITVLRSSAAADPQPLVADLGNIVNDTYTGVYHMTLTIHLLRGGPLASGPPGRRQPGAAAS